MMVLVLAAGFACQAQAQQLPAGMTADQLKQTLQNAIGNQNGTSQGSSGVAPQITVIDNPASQSGPLPQSNLEAMTSQRIGVPVAQFGYDQFGNGRAIALPQMGAVQDDYVLGPGDEIIVTLRGQENAEYRTNVDRDGRILLPKLLPIPAAGRTLGEVRKNLDNVVRTAYVETKGYLTIGQMRQISVLVSGEIGSPGVRTLTGLSTAVDAILASGGVKKTGSLRAIKILRGGREIRVDLYGVLVGQGSSKMPALADGDKIVVPPIGATVVVVGAVRRPAIYELEPGRSAVSARQVVGLAGGKLAPGAYTVSVLRMMPDGKRQLVDISNMLEGPVRDGDAVFVRSSVNVSVNQVSLAGAVRTPGFLALGKYRTLHDVLSSVDVLQPGAYMLMGIIDRTDPVSLQRVALPFSPLRVIRGKENMNLVSDDIIRILSKDDEKQLVRSIQEREGVDFRDKDKDEAARKLQETRAMLNAAAAQQNAATAQQGYAPNPFSQYAVPQAGAVAPGGSVPGGYTQQGAMVPGAMVPGGMVPNATAMAPGYGGYQSPTAPAMTGPSATAVTSGAFNPEISSTGLSEADYTFFNTKLADNRVSVFGAVNSPGTYLVGPGSTLADVLSGIGGLQYDADLQEFELTSTEINNAAGVSTTVRSSHPVNDEVFASLVLRPYDRVEFRRVFSDKYNGVVSVEGEVRYPGKFSILRSEKLSSVLRRAGGTTDVAYPEGAVFTRKSVVVDQEAQNSRIANDLRSQLLAFLTKARTSADAKMDPASVGAIEDLITRMSSIPAVGRVPVVADPKVLAEHPDQDILLEPGDRIVFPKRPSTVLVVGEVLQPGAQRYSGARSVDAYLDTVGGTTDLADTDRIIVVLPDGSVRGTDSSWLNFGFSARIPAGSTIYVPRKLETWTFHAMFIDSIQIFSQLATSVAALAVLSKQ